MWSRPTEGRHAIVTAAGRDAVDADGASDEGTECGRRSRVVLASRCWCQVFEKQASQGRRWQESRSPGRARYKLVNHCAGNAGLPPLTCMLVCVFFCASCTRDRGCSVHPVFPAPLFLEGQRSCTTRTHRAAGMRARVKSTSLRGALLSAEVR